MNTTKLLQTTALVVLASSLFSPVLAEEEKKKDRNSVFSGQTLKDKKSNNSFGAVFRRDAAVHKKRRIDRGRGPGFELGFDGHSGGT